MQGAGGGIAGVPISRHGVALSREGGPSVFCTPGGEKPALSCESPCNMGGAHRWGGLPPGDGRGASRRRPSRRSARLGSVHQRRPEFKSVLNLRRRHAGPQPWAQVIQAVYSASVSMQIVEKRLDAWIRRGRHCHRSVQHLRFGCGVRVGDGSLSTRRQPRIGAHVVSRVAPYNRVARGDVETIDDCDHGLCARRPLRAFLLELRRLVAGVLRRHGGMQWCMPPPRRWQRRWYG